MEGGYGKDKLDFQQIVLSHIKRILDLSTHELRSGTQVVNSGTAIQTTFQEDTRYSYIQAIENLAYVLIPYFDKEVKEIYTPCIKIMNGFGYEVKGSLKEVYDKVCKDTGKEDLGKAFILEMRLKYAKKLFIGLNELLHRNNYLKSSVFGEDKDEVAEGDLDEEEKD